MAGKKMNLIQSNDRIIQQMQTNIQNIVDPLIANPITNGILLQNVLLETGITNVIPTQLNRTLIGWFVTRLRGNAVVYDNQDNNLTPSQNLYLLTTADIVVDLYLF